MVNLLRFCINRIGRNRYFWNFRRIELIGGDYKLRLSKCEAIIPRDPLNYVWMPWQYIKY